jgi:hypothetical protein
MSDATHAGNPAEGYVRFHLQWTAAPAPAHPLLADLDALRTRLWDRGWIGITPDGIGFGNVSLRDPGGAGSLVITGTATGAARILGPAGYARVTRVDAPANTVDCTGPVRASAETMSHAALYEAHPGIQCVIHIHAAAFWRRALALGWPATPPGAEYGTPALAEAVGAVARRMRADTGLMVLAGHEEGLLAFGTNPAAAEAELLAAHAKTIPG